MITPDSLSQISAITQDTNIVGLASYLQQWAAVRITSSCSLSSWTTSQSISLTRFASNFRIFTSTTISWGGRRASRSVGYSGTPNRFLKVRQWQRLAVHRRWSVAEIVRLVEEDYHPCHTGNSTTNAGSSAKVSQLEFVFHRSVSCLRSVSDSR